MTVFFNCDKCLFFNKMKNLYPDKLTLLKSFKNYFSYFDVKLNNKTQKNQIQLLQLLNNKYNKYLEIILLSCNEYIIENIKNELNNEITLSHFENFKLKNKPEININLYFLSKQINIKAIFIIKNKMETREINVNFLFDLLNSEPILIKYT